VTLLLGIMHVHSCTTVVTTHVHFSALYFLVCIEGT